MRIAILLLGLALVSGCGGQSEHGASGGSGGSGGTSGTGGTSGSGGTAGTGGTPSDAGTDAGPPPAGQNILFEVSYENYAWAPSLSGVFVTADGNIWSYDFFAGGTDAQPPGIAYPATEQEIRARYGDNPTKIGTIPTSELFAHFALVKGAASGVLLRQYLCADAGENTFMGYLFDAATARYSPVILGADGDQAEKNLAPEADGLLTWLAQYSKLGGACTFNASVCTGATCPAIPPSCGPSQVPSVVNGCWGPCVSVDTCTSVNDCGQCPSGMVCAKSKDGSVHCLTTQCQNVDACLCPFAPPCAGGSAFCTSTGMLQVTCG